jgi:hypothetical protein
MARGKRGPGAPAGPRSFVRLALVMLEKTGKPFYTEQSDKYVQASAGRYCSVKVKTRRCIVVDPVTIETKRITYVYRA